MAQSRRDFIRNLIAMSSLGGLSTVPLPLLASDQTDRRLKFIFVALQHGWGHRPNSDDQKKAYLAQGSEDEFQFIGGFSPFNEIKSSCLYLQGLRGTDWGNAHDVSYSDILTASVPHGETSNPSGKVNNKFTEPMGPSIDHVLAEHFQTLGMRLSARYQSWGANYHPLCWDQHINPLAFHHHVHAAYDELVTFFNQIQNSNPGVEKRILIKRALLEMLGGKASQYMLELSLESEKSKLKSLEHAAQGLIDKDKKLLAQMQGHLLSGVPLPSRPNESYYPNDVDFYLEMIRLGFLADTHRVAVLGLGEGLPRDVENFSWINAQGQNQSGWRMPGHETESFHHSVAHWDPFNQNESGYIFQGYVRWHAQQIKSFYQTLQNTTDFNGRPMSENTVIVLTGEVGDGQHDRRAKPHLIITGASDLFQTGRYLNLEGVDPRNRNGFFLGSQKRDGTVIENGVNWGEHFSKFHHAELFTRIARLSGALSEDDIFGFPVYHQNSTLPF